jgi:hypothetical protein
VSDEEDDSNLVVLDPARVMFRDPAPPRDRRGITKYTPALAEAICESVASDPRGLMTVCKEKGWPHFTTIFRWRVQHEDFNRVFMMAQRMRAAMFMDQIIEIVDDARNDLIEIEDRLLPNPVSVQRSKIRADFRERVAKRLDPATWGDKIDDGQNVGYLSQDDAVKLLR